MNVDFQIIGKRIKERRKKLHLSQEKLAEMVDKSTVFISNLENGKRGASVESVIMICDTLGLSLDELLVGTVPEGTDRYLDMIATVFQQCTETEKRLISEVTTLSSVMQIFLREQKELPLRHLQRTMSLMRRQERYT